ncbi:MAG: GNAT family N-acetyltransferase [bacterium]
MKNLNQSPEYIGEVIPAKIDTALIKDIIDKLKASADIMDHNPDDEFENQSYDNIYQSRNLAHIFLDLYRNGESEGERIARDSNDNFYSDFDNSDYWSAHSEKENYVLLSAINTLLEYKALLGPIQTRKIIDTVTYRWTSVTGVMKDDTHMHNVGLYVKMRQIIFASLLVNTERGDDDDAPGDALLSLEIADLKEEPLSEDDVYQMRGIYSANYVDKPELRGILLEKFMDKVYNNPSTFVLVRLDGDIVGYYELENLGNNKIHFGKFNVSPGLEGVGLGSKLLNKKLNIDAKENIIFAESDLYSDASRNYLKNGFIAYKASEIGEITALSIARNDSANGLFESKKIGEKDVFYNDPRTGANIESYKMPDGETVILKSLWWTDPYIIGSHNVVKEIENLFEGKKDGKKYVMTRIFGRAVAGDDGGYTTYFVFEPVKEGDVDSYLNHRK